MTESSGYVETFLATTKRQPEELVAALRLIRAEAVHIGWSQAWKESGRGLVELPQHLRMAVFDLCAAEMAVPERTYAQTWFDGTGEEVTAARVVLTAEGRHLLDLLERT